MPAAFEQKLDHWEDWQRAYRFGVILVLPPEPVRSQVNALRAKYDPRSQSYCDAHISLTVPFPGEPSSQHWAELEAAASTVRPFSVHYGPPIGCEPHPGVVLQIEPQDQLDRLRASLESCPAFFQAAPRPYPFWAHMTIAEFVTLERSKSLLPELKDKALAGSFLCDGVSYVAPDTRFHFSERKKLALRG